MWYVLAQTAKKLDPRIVARYDMFNKDPNNDPLFGDDESQNNIKYFLGYVSSAYDRTKDAVKSIRALHQYFKALKFDPDAADKGLFDSVVKEFETSKNITVPKNIDYFTPVEAPLNSQGSVEVFYSDRAKQDLDVINPDFVKEVVYAATQAGLKSIYISTIMSGHEIVKSSGYTSRHARGQAMDVGRFNGYQPGTTGFITAGNALAIALEKLGYDMDKQPIRWLQLS